jgi:hypothetical protein
MSISEIEVSTLQKKKIICRNVVNLDHQSRLQIGQILFMDEETRPKIKESGDGCRINLDIVDSKIIDHIYSIILHKMNKTK